MGDDTVRQTVFRNAVGHDAARFAFGFEDIHLISFPGQVIGTGQAGGAGADNGDFLIQFCGRFVFFIRRETEFVSPVGSETLQLADVHFFIDRTAAAAQFARMRTDTSADAGERVVAQHDPRSADIIAGGDQAHVARDIDAGRAGVLAGRADQLGADTGAALLLADVVFVFIAEIFDRGQDRIGRCLAETAHGGVFDRIAELQQQFDVAFLAFPGSDPVQHFQHPFGTYTAGRTLAAGLFLNEVHIEPGRIDHAGVFVHDDQTAGSDNGAKLSQMFVIHRYVDVFRCDAAAGRSAGLGCLEFFAVRDPAADLIDDLGKRRAHRDLNETGIFDVAGQREDLGAGTLFSAVAAEPVGAVQHDRRYGSQGFHVVDDGGMFEQTALEREGRFLARLAALSFHRGDQGGFFAADESAGADADFDIEIKSGAEDVLAEQAGFLCLCNSGFQTFHGNGIFRTDVDDTVIGADRIAADQQSFDDAVRIAFKNRTVHERARVAFVGVADDVFLFAGLVVSGFPFYAGRETGAAASAQAGLFHFLNDRHPVACLQDPGECQIPVFGDVAVDTVDIDQAAVAQRDTDLVVEEGRIVDVRDPFFLNAVVEGVFFDRLSADEMLADDLSGFFRCHLGVVGFIRKDINDRSDRTGAHAAAFDHGYFVLQAVFGDFFQQGVADGLAS